MHKVLQISELVELVVSFVPTESLPAVAQTCRSFFLPGASFLFKSMDYISFTRFLRSFFTLADMKMGATLASSAKWPRFQMYTSFVEDFRLEEGRKKVTYMAEFLYYLFQLRPLKSPEPLFPRLRTLIYWAPMPSELDLVLFFLVSTLRTLVISSAEKMPSVVGAPEAAWTACWHRVLAALPEQSPNLRECRLMFKPAPEPIILQGVIDLLTNLNQVEYFGSGKATLHPKIMDVLATRPRLRHLLIDVDHASEWSPDDWTQTLLPEDLTPLNAENPFVGLRQLDLVALLMKDATRLLNLLPPNLDFVSINCFLVFEEISDISREVGRFVSTVRAQCSCLRMLEIDCSRCPNPGGIAGGWDAAWMVVSWDEFSSLLSCEHIEQFKLQFCSLNPLDLRDSHVEGISRAWRRLKSLGVNWINLAAPRALTLLALGSLAINCPKINYISLLSLSTQNAPAPPLNVVGRNPLYLALGTFPITNARKVGKYLAALSPSLTISLDVQPPYGLDPVVLANSDFKKMESKWSEVLCTIEVTRRRKKSNDTHSVPADKLIGLQSAVMDTLL